MCNYYALIVIQLKQEKRSVTMDRGKIARLMAIAVQLQPTLPEASIVKLATGPFANLLTVAAKYGLMGASTALGDTSMAQLELFFEQGSDSCVEMTQNEFSLGIAHLADTALSESDIPFIDKLKLQHKIHTYVTGSQSYNGNEVLDFDSPATTPLFTTSGFDPIDVALGEGMPQEVNMILGKPACGKSTVGISIAISWRKNVGPVTFLQSELPHSAMRMKIDQQTNGAKIWVAGEDKLVYGHRNIEQELVRLCEEGDQDRLIIIDSVTGMCGDGSNPANRDKYTNLMMLLSAAKNSNRAVLAFTHIKRGVTDLADIEDVAGSAFVERLSGSMIQARKGEYMSRDGRGEVKLDVIKNRYGALRPTLTFMYDFLTGEYDITDDGSLPDEFI